MNDPISSIRVVLADDHEVMRLGAATFLKTELGCTICGETADGREALRLAETLHPDVVVVDLALPGLNGFDLTRQIRRFCPETEVVVLTGSFSQDVINRVFEAGAKALVLKIEAASHLAEAVTTVAQHRYYLTPSAHEVLRQPQNEPRGTAKPATESLSDREREVVQALAEGKSNKEVAVLLGISIKTVETHRATIMRKLKLNSLSDLVIYAIRQKIIRL